jgi:hypothetical protein
LKKVSWRIIGNKNKRTFTTIIYNPQLAVLRIQLDRHALNMALEIIARLVEAIYDERVAAEACFGVQCDESVY